MLKAKVDDPETVQLIEGAAAGMVATVNRHGPEAVQDWEVDELLDWTTSLNFDEYIVFHVTELSRKSWEGTRQIKFATTICNKIGCRLFVNYCFQVTNVFLENLGTGVNGNTLQQVDVRKRVSVRFH